MQDGSARQTKDAMEGRPDIKQVTDQVHPKQDRK